MNICVRVSALCFLAAALVACSKSSNTQLGEHSTKENLTHLESVVAAAEGNIKNCENKKDAELKTCVSSVVGAAATEWTKYIDKASKESPDGVQVLIPRFTAVAEKGDNMLKAAP